MLFIQVNTQILDILLDIELKFGMLPLPKYDNAQEDYYDMASTQIMIIPRDAHDIEMTGVINEALSAESYSYVVPALYETTYSNKYLRDEESYEMFMIIRISLVYDFNWTESAIPSHI